MVHIKKIFLKWIFTDKWEFIAPHGKKLENLVTQASLSMEFSRQEYCSGLPFPTPRDLPDPGIEPTSPEAPALAGSSLPLAPPDKSRKAAYGKSKLD